MRRFLNWRRALSRLNGGRGREEGAGGETYVSRVSGLIRSGLLRYGEALKPLS